MRTIPIGIPVYTRIDHFKKCIESLKNNLLAPESDLFIYSDAASCENDELLVCRMREYAYQINGFKNVCVIEREENIGAAQNALLAWRDLMGKRDDGLAIFMEEDIVTAPGFLSFMNEALVFYKNNESIFSISGYCPPINTFNYEMDVFILPRYCAWGAGIFERTGLPVFQKIDKYEFEQLADKRVLSVGGEDVPIMVEMEVAGKLDAGDVRCMYYQALHNKYTVYPRKSLVQNIGHDGSGLHCGVSDKFHHEELWNKKENFDFIKDIKIDKKILRANKKFRRVGIKTRLIRIPVVKLLHDYWVSRKNK